MGASKRILLFLLLSGCGRSVDLASFDETAPPVEVAPGATEASARFVFHRDNFTNLEDFVTYQTTGFKCLGDITKTFYTSGGDYSASFTTPYNPPAPQAFEISNSNDAFQPTYRPAFVKNVSVDITRTYFLETGSGTVQTDACSKRTDLILPSPCADFDPGDGGALPAPGPVVATPTPLPTPDTPSDFAGLNFYRVRDPWCQGQGAMQSSNEPELSRAYVGGVNIDLDRKSMGANEDLLLLVTYQSFLEGASWPYVSPDVMTEDDRTKLRVDLIATGRALDELLDRRQPRVVGDLGEFGSSLAPPILIRKLATLEDSYPSLKTESILVPLSANVLVDRIRIERIRGSYQLYQVDLYRLGDRPPAN